MGRRYKKDINQRSVQELYDHDMVEEQTGSGIGVILKRLLAIIGLLFLVFGNFMLISGVRKGDLLPGRYFVVLLAVLGIIDLILILLMFVKVRGKLAIVRIILGLVICLFIAVGGIITNWAMKNVSDALDSITQENAEDINYKTTKVLSYKVYVLADDKAKEIKDISGYTVGLANSESEDANKKCEEALAEKTGQALKTKYAADVFEMAKDLYDGKTKALVLNEMYEAVFSESKDYAGFFELTKPLDEFSVEVEVEDTGAEEGVEQAHAKLLEEGEKAEEEKTKKEKEKDKKFDITKNPFVIYISGSDARTKKIITGRNDVNLLGIVNPTTKQVLLINTPRDYFIPNPAGNGALDKLTHCGNSGIACSMEALEGVYDIDIKYYARINFTGFETLVDALGGVDVESPVAFHAREADFYVKKGMNHLNGKQALAFCRERHMLANGDNDRGKNQMRMIKAIINKLSLGTLLLHYTDILKSLDGFFATNISNKELSSLVKMQLSDMANWNVQSYASTGTGKRAITYSIPGMSLYVCEPDQKSVDYAKTLIKKVFDGETITEDMMTMP